MSGRLIAVVGPSGVGKDSLIAGIIAARPGIRAVRRSITRPADTSEPFEPVDAAEFARRRTEGAFALDWTAHGLSYAIPIAALDAVVRGETVIANLSRGVLGRAQQVFGRLTILSVTASSEVLAARLGARGRESERDIASRLSRAAPPLPDAAERIEIDNSGPLQRAIDAALSALDAATPP